MPLDYAKVIGRLGTVIGDGPDAGDEPDTVWCTGGTVIIDPLITEVKVLSDSPVPSTRGVFPITLTVDNEGYLTRNGERHAFVLDLTSDQVTPRVEADRATHSVRFLNIIAGPVGDTFPVTFQSANVRITKDGLSGDGVNDLTLLTPLRPPAGIAVSVGPAGVGVEDVDPVAAAAGDLVLELSSGDSTTPVPLPVGPGGSDAGVAGYIETPGTATREALTAQTAEAVEDDDSPVAEAVDGRVSVGVLPARRVPNTIAYLGDSFTDMCHEQAGILSYYSGRGFITWAHMRLRQRLKLVARAGTDNGGMTGQTIAQIGARVQADALDLKPGFVHVLAGTNDIAGGIAFATSAAGLTAMYDAIEKGGARVVAGTIAPWGAATTAQRRATERLNTWIRRQAQIRPGFILVDYHQALAGADGDWRFPGSLKVTADQLHPSTGGAMRMAKALADALEPHAPRVNFLPTSNVDDAASTADVPNLLSNPMLTGTQAPAGVHTAVTGSIAAAPWALANYQGGNLTSGAIVASKVVRDDVPGEWQQFVINAAASNSLRFLTTLTTGWQAGDILQVGWEYEVENLAQVKVFRGSLTAFDSGPPFTQRISAQDNSIPTEDRDVAVFPLTYFPMSGVCVTPPVTLPAQPITGITIGIDLGIEGTVRVGRPFIRRIRL